MTAAFEKLELKHRHKRGRCNVLRGQLGTAASGRLLGTKKADPAMGSKDGHAQWLWRNASPVSTVEDAGAGRRPQNVLRGVKLKTGLATGIGTARHTRARVCVYVGRGFHAHRDGMLMQVVIRTMLTRLRLITGF